MSCEGVKAMSDSERKSSLFGLCALQFPRCAGCPVYPVAGKSSGDPMASAAAQGWLRGECADPLV